MPRCRATTRKGFALLQTLVCAPELLKGMLQPVFKYARTPEWPYEFAPHDVGRYPKANGQVYRNNILEQQMPIEECGNVLIACTAISLAEQSAGFAEEHWDILTQWVNYLCDHGLDPGNQLCTDDFAGHLAHNANLSIKAVLGIGGYALLCKMLDKSGEHQKYLKVAQDMARQWEEMAFEGDHYRLAFDLSDSWSLKYNLVWDDLFDLHLFSPQVKSLEVARYLKQQNRYGTPLDNRADYSKSDWIVWAATLADHNEDFRALIKPLWRFLNESSSRVPFSDWYWTTDGRQRGFQNRSVVGGHFMKLLQKQWADD